MKSEPGLLDVLEDEALDIAGFLLRTNIERLSLFPAGRTNLHATELLASQRMAEIVQELGQRYPNRVIILDSPPLLASSEPSALALHVGQIVFIVEAYRTSEEAITAGLELIDMCDNISLVLNKAGAQFGSDHFGSYYSQYPT